MYAAVQRGRGIWCFITQILHIDDKSGKTYSIDILQFTSSPKVYCFLQFHAIAKGTRSDVDSPYRLEQNWLPMERPCSGRDLPISSVPKQEILTSSTSRAGSWYSCLDGSDESRCVDVLATTTFFVVYTLCLSEDRWKTTPQQSHRTTPLLFSFWNTLHSVADITRDRKSSMRCF